jgi:ribosome-associated toxin RatA of RatAB toxin-antitoxin module
MSVSESRTVTIGVAVDQVLVTIRDVAGNPRWWPGMVSTELLESDDQGRPVRARLVSDVRVAKDTYELDYTHTDSSMSWRLHAPSKAQRDMSGSWELVDAGGATEATLTLTIDTTLPLPGFVQRKVITETITGATDGLKAFLGG